MAFVISNYTYYKECLKRPGIMIGYFMLFSEKSYILYKLQFYIDERCRFSLLVILLVYWSIICFFCKLLY